MFQFFLSLGQFLRGKNYIGDFTKTLILGLMCYIIGFIIILLQILVYEAIGNEGVGIAIIYYIILMPIILIPIMGLYFLLLILIRFFLSYKS